MPVIFPTQYFKELSHATFCTAEVFNTFKKIDSSLPPPLLGWQESLKLTMKRLQKYPGGVIPINNMET